LPLCRFATLPLLKKVASKESKKWRQKKVKSGVKKIKKVASKKLKAVAKIFIGISFFFEQNFFK
jgi:hypothetical protein